MFKVSQNIVENVVDKAFFFQQHFSYMFACFVGNVTVSV